MLKSYLIVFFISMLPLIELRGAIEELGGEAPEREFYADPEYEALHPMDDGDDDTPMQ